MLGRLRKLRLLRPLEGRSFRRLWLGQGLSLLADQTFFVALTLLVSQVAGVGVELGSVLAVSAIPGAVLTPVGGALADRFSPATLMVVASAGRAVLLSLLAAIVLLDAVALCYSR